MPGVYISYPFCAQKCTYCNFASGIFAHDLEHDYVDALLSEIGQCQWPWIPETIYLGGGTPSGMDAHHLARILSVIPGRPWREATIEAAPGSLTVQRVTDWVAAGIHRVSLGVQSFVRGELARTGRKHTAEIVASEIDLLRRHGITNINVDLIAGLPGQTIASWRESLDWIERLAPPHVSVYMLEIDDDSRLGHEILLNGKRYGAPDVPSEDRTAEMYEMAVDALHRIGIHRYEISNFAQAGFESLHNLKYWKLERYIGFGSDAHSFDGQTRSQNVESPQDYVRRVREGQPSRLVSTRANPAEERFFVGLRLSEGILPELEEWRAYERPIQRFIADGLLAHEGDRLRLTDRGVLLSNEVFAEFVTP
jgi:putative oxygen-independent coproporphyrinogen III oxidase